MAEFGPVQALCLENQGPMILAVSYVLLSLAIVAVGLRLYLRLGLRHGISSDDYVLVASCVAACAGVGCLTKFVLEGMGRHIYCLSPEQISRAIMWSIIAQILNIIGIGLAKISVCLCVLRILDRTRTGIRIFLWVVIAFVSASHLCQILLFLVQCRPISAEWDPHIPGKCFSAHITYLAGYIGFGLDAFTDFVCAGIPILVLRRLQINTRTKTALCCLMGVGSLTAGCAIAKAVTLKGVFAEDYTWAITKPAICTIVEHLSSLTLISLPALKPLFNKVLDASRGVSSKRSNRPYAERRHGVGDSYAHEKELGTNDTERDLTSFDHKIVKTMDIRVGSEHNSNMSEDTCWQPLPSNMAYAERFDSQLS